MSKPLDNSQAKPNPQGKGLVPVLQDLATMRAVGLGPKTPAAFLRDYCISSLVLAASFSFKPVPGKTYFLYARKSDWSLSLISPAEWGGMSPGDYLGSCRLRRDMTWEMDTSGLDKQSPALSRAKEYIEEFVVELSGQDSISEGLPFYVRELPYYQRMLGAALSSSLQQSLPPSGDRAKALLSEQTSLSLLLSS